MQLFQYCSFVELDARDRAEMILSVDEGPGALPSELKESGDLGTAALRSYEADLKALGHFSR